MKNRRSVVALLLVSAVLGLGALVLSIGHQLQAVHLPQLGSPAMARAVLDGRGVAHRLPGDQRPTLLIAYRATCSHCLAEFAALRARSDAWSGADVVLITAYEPRADVVDPPQLAALRAMPGVFHGVASPREILGQFGTPMTPANLIYVGGRLQARFVGETSIEQLSAALHRGSK